MSAIDQFRAAIKAAGMEPPDTLHADGHLHRFSPTGKHADLAAWYVLHNDGLAAGVFGCWRSGRRRVGKAVLRHAGPLRQR